VNKPTVHINREPLLNMLLAAAETYNRECLGYVFGSGPTRKRRFFRITNVIAIQGVRRRTNVEIEQSQRSWKRLHGYIKSSLRLYPILGDFHSHPASGPYKKSIEMSETDIMGMRKDSDAKIGIIIGISSRTKKRVLWNVPVRGPHTGILRGSLAGFTFKVCAYTLATNGNAELVPKRLRIVAPAALKALNRVNAQSA